MNLWTDTFTSCFFLLHFFFINLPLFSHRSELNFYSIYFLPFTFVPKSLLRSSVFFLYYSVLSIDFSFSFRLLYIFFSIPISIILKIVRQVLPRRVHLKSFINDIRFLSIFLLSSHLFYILLL